MRTWERECRGYSLRLPKAGQQVPVTVTSYAAWGIVSAVYFRLIPATDVSPCTQSKGEREVQFDRDRFVRFASLVEPNGNANPAGQLVTIYQVLPSVDKLVQRHSSRRKYRRLNVQVSTYSTIVFMYLPTARSLSSEGFWYRVPGMA